MKALMRNQGFTLLEMLIGIVVSGFVIIAATELMGQRLRNEHFLTLKLNTERELREFIQARKRAFTTARATPSFLNPQDSTLPTEEQVWRGISVGREMIGGDWVISKFNEVIDTRCVSAPEGVTLDPRIFSCITCPTGQMPVITIVSNGVTQTFPVGNAQSGDVHPFSAALCIHQTADQKTFTLQVSALTRAAKDQTEWVAVDMTLPTPQPSASPVKVYGNNQQF